MVVVMPSLLSDDQGMCFKAVQLVYIAGRQLVMT